MRSAPANTLQRRLLSLALVASLFLVEPLTICGRASAQAAAATAAAPKAIYIDIIEGEGELNDIRARTAREPIVEVKDENHRPVAGAIVIFAVQPGSSQMAAFPGGPAIAVRTGADGRAAAQGYRSLNKTGQVQILVKVIAGAAVAEVTLHQTNFASGSLLRRTASNHKVLLGTAVAAAAGVSLGLVLSRDNGTTISPGVGVVRGVVVNRP